jgi:hypothetical protein
MGSGQVPFFSGLPEKSALAESSVGQGYRVQFHTASILATKTIYMDRNVREVIGIELHPYNMKKEGVHCLSKSWKNLICSLKHFGT